LPWAEVAAAAGLPGEHGAGVETRAGAAVIDNHATQPVYRHHHHKGCHCHSPRQADRV